MIPVVPPLDVAIPAFAMAVRLRVEAGLDAAAILDGKGRLLAIAGALDSDEARAIAAHATRHIRVPDLLERLLEGEMFDTSIGARAAAIGIAARSVFFVVVFPTDPADTVRAAVEELRSDVEQMVHDAKRSASTPLVPPTSSGGSSSGPAELPVVELGVTVRRKPE